MEEEKVEEVGVSELSNKPPKLTKEKEVEMFKMLAFKSYKDVGKEFGWHHFYKNDKHLTVAVYNIAKKIRKAPDLWGISQDTVDVITEALDSRSVNKNPRIRSDMALQEESFRDRLDTMRDKVADMIMKKLAGYGKNAKTLEGISIRDLKDLLATAVDKGRLLRGEGTDSVTKLSKLDVDSMSPEEAMKVIMKAREMVIENKK